MELMLTNRGPGCTPAWYTVAGETEFIWWPPIPDLVFVVQRLLDCDPPTPPQPEACLAGMDFSCAPVELAYECAPLGMDLATVDREELPDTSGPGEEAIRLPPGH